MKLFDNIIIRKRLKNAVKLISKPAIEDRLIGLNDLEKIAIEHPEKYDNVIQIITKFIQNNRSLKLLNDSAINPVSEISNDIQAALKIITNPDIDEYLRRNKMDLDYIDIRGANLNGANLKNINLQQSILYRANLIGANLENVNLSGSVLSAANFTRANLVRANLSGAILNAANLSDANLTHADLRCANLFLANLQGANIQGASLDKTNLREADFCSNRATTKSQN